MNLNEKKLEILRKTGSSDVQDLVDEVRRLHRIELAAHALSDITRGFIIFHADVQRAHDALSDALELTPKR